MAGRNVLTFINTDCLLQVVLVGKVSASLHQADTTFLC